MHPVSEYEAPLAPPHPRVGVALPGLVVPGSLAIGLEVGAVDGDDLCLHRPGVHQPPAQVVEDPVVGVLSKAFPEVGEARARSDSTTGKGAGSPKINVNCVAPGLVYTYSKRIDNPDEMTLEQRKEYEKLMDWIPAKRVETPTDIAEVIIFMASDYAGYIHG